MPENLDGQEKEASEVSKEPGGESKSGGGLGALIKAVIKGIADALFDTPGQEQQKQSGSIGNGLDQQQGQDEQDQPQQEQGPAMDISVKIEENPDLEKEVKEEGEKLKKGIQRSGVSSESFGENITPNKSPGNDEEITTGGRGM